ncbi:winged helix-turn-helix transcriptional regulator [Rhizobium sp. KVB221]|uniref:Winged helix-turn-helix transcriptional regulator n=1 Tax=Rhizobium setariae TaxID=2801340 RepID=A0A937CQ44_9HYPH|nr:MarR family winged helix-turn-helix transcriptional regulator [Rhizobium setariae]MBL0373358.1 winged helix-turn-helix transcriptional regulator [Rhizobium setariae]
MNAVKSSSRHYVSYRLELLARSVNEPVDRIYREKFGYDIRQLRVLRVIDECPGRSVFVVVQESFLERSLVSRIISLFVRKKLVQRTISPNDARQYLLETTPAGNELVRQADMLGEALNNDFLDVLDSHEIEVFERCLVKLANWRPGKQVA